VQTRRMPMVEGTDAGRLRHVRLDADRQ